MLSFLIIVNALIFTFIAALHFYWFFGGKWARDAAIPTYSTGQQLFSPGKLVTLLVALGLTLFVLITISNWGIFNSINKKYTHYATVTIGIIFILRALGDFRFVGLSKRIKNTKFGMMDTKIYTPLCFLIGIISLLIAILY